MLNFYPWKCVLLNFAAINSSFSVLEDFKRFESDSAIDHTMDFNIQLSLFKRCKICQFSPQV